MSGSLRGSVDRFSDWFKQDCLPGWSKYGVDPVTKGGLSRLSGDIESSLQAPKDVKDSALLAWVLSVSEHRGWCESAEATVRQLHVFAGRHGTRPCRSDGYVRRVAADLSIVDGSFHLSDHAAFIRSSLTAYEVYGNGGDFRRALNILDWLDYWMRSDHASFYYPGLPVQPPFATASQLPMLEMFLYLYHLTRKDRWLTRASGMVDVFRGRFYNTSRTGVLARVDEQLCAVDDETDMVMAARWVHALLRLEQGRGPVSSETFALCETVLTRAIPATASDKRTDMLARLSGVLCLGFQLLADGREVSLGLMSTLEESIDVFFEWFATADHPVGYVDTIDSASGEGVATTEGLFHICRVVVHADRWMKAH